MTSAQWVDREYELRQRGWDVVFVGCETTDLQGFSAGVCIATRRFLGATPLFLRDAAIVPHRAVHVHVDAWLKGGVVVITVYLIVGIGLAQANWDILVAISDFIAGLQVPWLVAVDYNMSPENLQASGWTDSVGGKVVFTPSPTCHSKGKGSTIDFMVAHPALLPFLKEFETMTDTHVKVHDPIKIVFEGCAAEHWKMVQVKPKPLPRQECRSGPDRPGLLEVWGDEYDAAVGQDTSVDDDFTAFMSRAEDELLERHAIPEAERPAYRGRGLDPVFRMVRVAPPAVGPSPFRVSKSTRALHMCHARVSNFARAAWRYVHLDRSDGQRHYLVTAVNGVTKFLAGSSHHGFAQLLPFHILVGLVRFCENLPLGFLLGDGSCFCDLAAECLRVALPWLFQFGGVVLAASVQAHHSDLSWASKQMKEWLHSSRCNGGGAIHRYTKTRAVPFKAEKATDDPSTTAGLVLHRWVKVWQTNSSSMCRFAGLENCHVEIEDPNVDELTAGLKKYSWNTGLGTDCFPPRCLLQLSREAVARLCQLFGKCERSGKWPRQVMHIIFCQIPNLGVQGTGL